MVLALGLAAAQEWTAQSIVALSYRAANPRGVCVVPQGGTLAMELAQRSQFQVLAQVADEAAFQLACAEAERAGLLASRLTVVRASADRPMVGDYVANIVVYQNLDAAAPAGLNPGSLIRALAPCGGQLFMGLKGVKEQQFRAWAQTQEAITVRDGWFIITRGPLAGTDDWTHRFHDAANTSISTDTVFKMPPITQWVDKPWHDGESLGLLWAPLLTAIF